MAKFCFRVISPTTAHKVEIEASSEQFALDKLRLTYHSCRIEALQEIPAFLRKQPAACTEDNSPQP